MTALARITLHDGQLHPDSVITILFDGHTLNESRLGTRLCEIAREIGNVELAAIIDDLGTGRQSLRWGDLIHVLAYWSWLPADGHWLPSAGNPWPGGDVYEVPLRLNA